jgi:quercetin dioxygenase-like cupin family protein
LILALYEHRDGVETGPGNRVAYSVDRNEAFFGAATVEGHALRWELAEEDEEHPPPKLSAAVELDPGVGWLMRCDRIDFPPGGVAYRHTHPGPGIRYLLHGSLRIEESGVTIEYRVHDAWFEVGPDPVVAVAAETEETAFVRVMLLPREWAGKRTIRYVDPGDEDMPKLQRATVFLDEPIEL